MAPTNQNIASSTLAASSSTKGGGVAFTPPLPLAYGILTLVRGRYVKDEEDEEEERLPEGRKGRGS